MSTERVHIIIGDIPFDAEVVEAAGLPGGCGCVRLNESVGSPENISSNEATTYFAVGTLCVIRWLDERHPMSGRRQGRLMDAREFGPPGMPIDERVKFLVDVLNSLPGIETFSSCGGHDNPAKSQCPADEFYVCFGLRELKKGMRSLRRIAWAALCFPGGEGGKVDLTVWWNGDEEQDPAESMPLSFELRGSEGADPDELATLIEEGDGPTKPLDALGPH
jgi:hypothetical protein